MGGGQQGPKWNVCPRCDPAVTQPIPLRPAMWLLLGHCSGGLSLLVPCGSAQSNLSGPRNTCDSALIQDWRRASYTGAGNAGLPTCRLLLALESFTHGVWEAQEELRMGMGEEISKGSKEGSMHCLEFAPAVKLDIMTPEGMVSAFPCPKAISAQSPGLKPRELLPSAYYS